jgi:hypothetical protein
MKTKLFLIFSVLFLLGVATPFFASVKDSCLNFEDGDYVTCSGIPSYSAITIEGWINHSNITATTQRYFTMMNETAVIRKSGSSIGLYVKSSSGSLTHVTYAYSFIIGQWVHVAGTYDGTTAKLYVDGNLVNSATTPGGIFINTGEFRIGNDGESMRGQIDDVRLWSVARTQEQIAGNRNNELTGTETGLVSYWKLNDGNGTVALDVMESSHGTLVNMTDANWIVFDPSGDWLWAKQGGGTSEDYVRDIAKDSNGNTYIVGNFYGTATFGSFTVSSLDPSAPVGQQYSNNIYVAKLDADGNYLWASEAGGKFFDSGYCIATDTSGNAYITGVFSGQADFGTLSLTSSGSSDVFIAKLSTNGTWIWAVKAGGTGADIGTSIATDTSNNVYVTGAYTGTATFGTTSLTSSGGEDIFIAKLNSSGTWGWARSAGGTDTDRGYGITVYGNNSICVTGSFTGTATFGSNQISSSGGSDVFIVKLNNSGSWGAPKRCGGSGNDISYGIDSDSSGNFYVTGTFQGTASFGTYSLTSNGNDDIFVTKLDGNCNHLWAKQAGGTGNDSGYSIASAINGNSYVTGCFNGTATFGTTQLSSIGSSDIYVAKLGSNGNWLWGKQVGSSTGDFGYGIASDSDGYANATGTFKGTVSFGSTSLTSSGESDVYIAKIDHDIAVLELNESSIAFGTGYIGDTKTHTLWLKNRGFESLLVESYAFGQTDSPFNVIGHIPCVIAPGDSISFQIRFSPLVIGAAFDVLNIYSDAANLPTAVITLSGTGASLAPLYAPMNLNIVMDGSNAVISWDAVTETETHEPIVPDYYLVFFNGSADIYAPFYYHGATPGLQYTHYLVGLHSPHMFYRIIAYKSGSRSGLDLTEMGLREGMSESEVLRLLR